MVSKGASLKDTNAFHLNQFENGQQSDNDNSPRSLFRKKAMKGHASILPLEEASGSLEFYPRR